MGGVEPAERRGRAPERGRGAGRAVGSGPGAGLATAGPTVGSRSPLRGSIMLIRWSRSPLRGSIMLILWSRAPPWDSQPLI